MYISWARSDRLVIINTAKYMAQKQIQINIKIYVYNKNGSTNQWTRIVN